MCSHSMSYFFRWLIFVSILSDAWVVTYTESEHFLINGRASSRCRSRGTSPFRKKKKVNWSSRVKVSLRRHCAPMSRKLPSYAFAPPAPLFPKPPSRISASSPTLPPASPCFACLNHGDENKDEEELYMMKLAYGGRKQRFVLVVAETRNLLITTGTSFLGRLALLSIRR